MPMRNSKLLTGLLRKGSLRSNKKSTSVAVSRTAVQSGMLGNSRTMAIADPSNSARSVLIIATSDRTYRG
jgi:hypothetical protein